MTNEEAPLDFPGGGMMGGLIRSIDWSATPLGPATTWSPTLRMVLRFLLANRFPTLLWWGPRFCQFYNDAYRPVLGEKHPKAMGQPGPECWAEIWGVLGPLAETPYGGGPPTWTDDLALEINRHGFSEETHFIVAYSPVPDETAPGGIGGVLATVHEITEKVVGERRVRALRDLGSRALEAKTDEEACLAAADVIGNYPKDIPFALLYLLDAESSHARLACAVGMPRDTAASPGVVDLGASEAPWPLADAMREESHQVVTDLARRFPESPATGPWSDPPREAVVLPIRSNIAHRLVGFLVAGVSSRLRFDEAYRSFLELAASQIATVVANARAYEEERRRAEALAQLDRAKTAFFSNVSHEFRTPLTLMLGPVEEALERPWLGVEERERLMLVHRNGLRLQKLVNTLLEFSRIEAGRARASYRATDLPSLTADLAGAFRSAIEQAGLTLVVHCPPREEPAWVDPEMWEKIVLNLLSNAFKFTFEGSIEVCLEQDASEWRLTVRDTGIGVEADDLARIFDRFHRVEGARGRSYEGSGIGLALVRELARLHGGTVRAESEPGRGTLFTVTLPRGHEHLPADRLRDRGAREREDGARAYVEEALRWLPGAGVDVDASIAGAASHASGAGAGEPAHASPAGIEAPRVLLADDNADLRSYVRRLLSPYFDVECVVDGQAALEAIRRRRPALVLSDVMMPRLDGIELLRTLRADPRTATLPVILLSARAGEESRVEGMQLGADDYLVKPFSARELVARVGARIAESARREAESRVLEEEQRRKDEFLATLAHEMRNPLAPIRNAIEVLNALGSPHPDAEWARGVVERQVANLARLLDDLLDISRIAKSRLELKRDHIPVSHVVERGLETSRPLIDAAGHHLVVQLPESELWLDADPLRMSQVLSNLLNNAAKYTPAGGRIGISVRGEDGEVVLSVEDDGIGISGDLLPHVFEMFTRGASGIGQELGGLGIGLSLVRGIVEAHGGTVVAKSAGPSRGSEFIVRLPAVPAPSEPGEVLAVAEDDASGEGVAV